MVKILSFFCLHDLCLKLSNLQSALQFSDGRPNKGRCTERDVEYFGTYLDISNNGPRNKVRNHKACRRNCRDTQGCNYWVYVSRSESNRRLRNACYLLSDKFTQQTNLDREVIINHVEIIV